MKWSCAPAIVLYWFPGFPRSLFSRLCRRIVDNYIWVHPGCLVGFALRELSFYVLTASDCPFSSNNKRNETKHIQIDQLLNDVITCIIKLFITQLKIITECTFKRNSNYFFFLKYYSTNQDIILPLFCICPKTGPGVQIPHAMGFLCLVCGYCWNCSPSLFKLSFHIYKYPFTYILYLLSTNFN